MRFIATSYQKKMTHNIKNASFAIIPSRTQSFYRADIYAYAESVHRLHHKGHNSLLNKAKLVMLINALFAELRSLHTCLLR
jgi:hypothetical protein